MTKHSNYIDLLVAVCVTKKDWLVYKDNLIRSFDNIINGWSKSVMVYIILQGDSSIDSHVSNVPNYVSYDETNFMGVSSARNRCIEKAKSVNAEFIVFHDASIFFPLESVKFMDSFKDRKPKLKASFSSDLFLHTDSLLKSDGFFKKINPIYDAYVWTYLFRLEDIKDIRFNEKFGPGQETRYKSGEDVIFLFEYFHGLVNKSKVYESKTFSVFHPERDASFDKHLMYAKGQGKVFRFLLRKHLSLRLCLDVVLFFGNAIFRCLCWKKNSFKIIRQRIMGFLDEEI